MDNYALDLLMYLDEGLVKNLSSLVLSGYIDIRTTKIIQDRTLLGRTSIENKEHKCDEDRSAKDEREGYKGINSSTAMNYQSGWNNSAGLENREFVRREEEIKKNYTSFTLHSQLIHELEQANVVKNFTDTTIKEGEIKAGEYIKVHGTLTSESINSYLDSMLSLIDCFGGDALDQLVVLANEKKSIKFNALQNFLVHLKDILDKNSTQDLILKCGDTNVVVNVNRNFFMNNNAYVYDRINCPCTVFGKVIYVAPSGDCVSLLRKTAQHSYYEKMLSNMYPYYSRLNSTGILVPDMPRLKCDGLSIVILPISICI